jgi:small ligand-binding sensory domain FIST
VIGGVVGALLGLCVGRGRGRVGAAGCDKNDVEPTMERIEVVDFDQSIEVNGIKVVGK